MTLPIVYPAMRVNGASVLSDVDVTASLSAPWRTARLQAVPPGGALKIEAGYAGLPLEVLFESSGVADDQGAERFDLADALLRGLPAWRKEVGPQAFLDSDLGAVLRWLAGACGGALDLKATGSTRRHYQVQRGPAYRAVQEALASWRSDAVLLELDGSVLHVGPEATTPHALAGVQVQLQQGRSIFELLSVGGGHYRLSAPGVPSLRVGHRVGLRHQLVTGTARIIELRHSWGALARTWMEVVSI